jgi:YebC/PmpR family DNA-binding regulatory protein
MSGHSHWAGIKYKKAIKDAKKGKIFGKLSKELMVASRLGGSDPDTNPRLRMVLDKARRSGMPRENIKRAVKKGAGELEGVDFQEVTYEGYGPGGVAIIVQGLTDNTNRTTPELRRIFEKRGGNMGSSGSTAWMFKRKGLFGIPKGEGDAAEDESPVSEERLIEISLEAGADDVVDAGSNWEVTCPAQEFDAVRKALEAAELSPTVAELTFIAENELELDRETQKRNLRLMEDLEEHDDIQNVYAAFTPSEEAVAEMGEG